jgi:glycosyltransferase involved in cell wall biosynthesis
MKKFTVVIPTRNRLNYLKIVLNHIVNDQSFNPDDTDIIIAENNCHDGTKEYLKNIPNIIVYSSEVDLSMTDNWSRIFPIIKSEWVIFIGDDDCLVPNFFSLANKWIDFKPDIDIVNWVAPTYRWPSAPDDSNSFSITLFDSPSILSCNDYINKCFSSLHGIMAPPSLYHSICRTDLIQRCIDKYGEFNVGFVPDFGSGILFMSVANSYLRTPSPLSVMGFGSKSTGASFKATNEYSESRDEFIRLTKYTSDNLLLSFPPYMDSKFADVLHLKMMGSWRDYFSKHDIYFPEIKNEILIKYLIGRISKINPDSRERFVDELILFAKNVLPNLTIDKNSIFQNNKPNNFKPGLNINKGIVSMSMLLSPNIIDDVSKVSYLAHSLSFRSN